MKIRQQNYSTNSDQIVAKWLFSSAFMVLIMIFIGGITRLTDSGLSIIYWKPITGIIPPISYVDWLGEFAKYKTSPEFKLLNSTMTLDEFKFIYYLELIQSHSRI